MNYRKKFKKIVSRIDTIKSSINPEMNSLIDNIIHNDITMIENHLKYFNKYTYHHPYVSKEQPDINIDKISDEVIRKLHGNENFFNVMDMMRESVNSSIKNSVQNYINSIEISEKDKRSNEFKFRNFLTKNNAPNFLKILPFDSDYAILFSVGKNIYVTPTLRTDITEYVKNDGTLDSEHLLLEACIYTTVYKTFIPTQIYGSIDSVISICDDAMKFIKENFTLNDIVESYFNDIKDFITKTDGIKSDDIDYFKDIKTTITVIVDNLKYDYISTDIEGLYIKNSYYMNQNNENDKVLYYKEYVILIDTSKFSNEHFIEIPFFN